MLAFLIHAAALVAQPAKAGPVEAVYVVHGGRNQIDRLLDEWSGSGTIRRAGRGDTVGGIPQCIAPRHPRTVDVACVRRLIGRRGRGPAAVAIIAVDAGRVNVVYDVSCIGPDGVGRASLNPNTGPFSPHAPLRERTRSDLAVCVSTALRGSVADSPVEPAASSPPATAFLIEAPGREPDRQGLHRLLFDSWRSRAGVRPVEQGGRAPDWSSCRTGRPRRFDPECARRLLPRRGDGIPVVALIVVPAPDPFYSLTIHCVGASGAGSTPVILPLANVDRSDRTSRLSNNARSGIARCINQAAPGAVVGDTW